SGGRGDWPYAVGAGAHAARPAGRPRCAAAVGGGRGQLFWLPWSIQSWIRRICVPLRAPKGGIGDDEIDFSRSRRYEFALWPVVPDAGRRCFDDEHEFTALEFERNAAAVPMPYSYPE